jgi:stage II sporulation protein AA (anti-sigma F factor antagonist)
VEIQQLEVQSTVVLRLIGRLDGLTSPDLDMQIKQLIAQNKHKFILDFGQLDYISSAGLRVLLMLQKQLKGVGGKSILVNLKPDIHHIFDISGFSVIFDFSLSVEDALTAIS